MLNGKSLTFVFILTLIASITLNAAENAEPKRSAQDAQRRFGKSTVTRFEQMFQSGDFDFTPQGHMEYTVLHYAAFLDDLDRVKLLIEKGADVNAKNRLNTTPLFFAANNDNLEMVKLLVENGADVNNRDYDDGNPALFVAALKGNWEMFQYLVENGADILIENGDGCSALHAAAEGGNFEIVKWLIKKGLDVKVQCYYDRSCLHHAAKSGNIEMIKWFIDKGLDIKAKDFGKRTVLHYAAEGGHLEMVQWLVEQGLDINDVIMLLNRRTRLIGGNILIDSDNNEFDLLSIAARAGNLELVQWLVEQGMDAVTTDNEIRAAVKSGNIELVEWLVNQGANINREKNLLFYATLNGNLKLVQYLVNQGVDIKKSENVLQGAAYSGNMELIQWLIEHGADDNSNENSSILAYAIDSHDVNVLRFFVEDKKINVNTSISSARYYSPLEYAVNTYDFEMVKYLVEHGADVNPYRWTCIIPYWYYLSQRGDDPEIVKYFRERDNTLMIWGGILSLIVISVTSYIIYRNLRPKKLVEEE
ncbi:MAG: ankyrin repeat domain-containing protein [Thermoguttaceae bacterium]|nr:ankyrin repeat domain-containing protein [Thermoguttaceae bacterium]